MDQKEKPSFWATLPGMITALATLITAICGCIAIIVTSPRIFDAIFSPSPTPVPIVTSAPSTIVVIPTQPSEVPLVETVNVSNHPVIPAGLKLAFFTGPDSPTPDGDSPTCNIIRFKHLKYWAYSYIDNRLSMAIVAYDSSNNIVRQWEEGGARYLWKITIDPNSQTVTLYGQGNYTIVIKWSDLAE